MLYSLLASHLLRRRKGSCPGRSSLNGPEVVNHDSNLALYNDDIDCATSTEEAEHRRLSALCCGIDTILGMQTLERASSVLCAMATVGTLASFIRPNREISSSVKLTGHHRFDFLG